MATRAIADTAFVDPLVAAVTALAAALVPAVSTAFQRYDPSADTPA